MKSNIPAETLPTVFPGEDGIGAAVRVIALLKRRMEFPFC